MAKVNQEEVQSTQAISTSVAVNENRKFTAAEAKRKNLINIYKNENKVSTYLSPMYKAHFGNIMTVTICGISIRFRVDGSKQEVPATFADEIERRRMSVDNIINKQKRMADITKNIESSPGGITLF